MKSTKMRMLPYLCLVLCSAVLFLFKGAFLKTYAQKHKDGLTGIVKTGNEAGGPENKIPEVPVLCYHQVRDRTAADSKTARAFIIPPARFREQIKMLHDSGYKSILPDELVGYHRGNTTLPRKSVMITFDDGTLSEYVNALPVLEQYGYKAVFFIMTVTLNKPGYMGRDQVKELSDKGNVIGCHTWDHHNVTGYKAADWNTQLTEPGKHLERITGRPVKYFAYPFGIWDDAAIEKLKASRYAAAFQLSGRKSPDDPLYTIRRIIADGDWKASQLAAAMKRSFH